MTFGDRTLSCLFRKGMHVAASSGIGVPVPRWAAFHDVRDEHLFSRVAHGFDDPGQELPGLSDERPSLNVLIRAGSFPDEDEIGIEVSFTDHDVFSALVQVAAGAAFQLPGDPVERIYRVVVRMELRTNRFEAGVEGFGQFGGNPVLPDEAPVVEAFLRVHP